MNNKVLDLVTLYNELNHKTHDATTQTIQKMLERQINKYSYEVLEKMIKDKVGVKFYDLFADYHIDMYVNEQQPVKQDTPQNLTLGAIEKALAQVLFNEYVPQVSKQAIEHLDEYIAKTYGKIEKEVTLVNPLAQTKLEEVTHEKFNTVLKYIQANEPVMLVGPAGTGKNVICKQIAKLLNLEFYFSNAITQEYKLTGFIDANGNYHETQFYKAFKNGGLFMLDEMDASIPETLIILNSAIANRYFDFPNGKIEAHENFRIISAGNTYGQGASYQYVGRNQLDGASLDRFAIVHIDYSTKIENSLTSDTELLEFVRAFRKAINKAGINHIVSYRAINRLSKLSQMIDEEFTLKDVLTDCLTKNLEVDDLRQLKNSLPENNKYTKEYEKLCK